MFPFNSKGGENEKAYITRVIYIHKTLNLLILDTKSFLDVCSCPEMWTDTIFTFAFRKYSC